MSVFLNLAGVLWCILGAGVFIGSASAIHEILGCLAVTGPSHLFSDSSGK